MAVLNESDFESPGYEFLRSYQSMANLHLKLVNLNYRKDFCSIYKCPPIHKYYFSIPSKNKSEQQFIFVCLCSWLIKYKCQMNMELEPEEYDDPSTTLSTIIEAVRLLVIPEEDYNVDDKRMIKGLQPVRLKQGFGPEVIWTLNILADRAIELIPDDEFPSSKRAKIIFNSKGLNESAKESVSSKSITIGQPFVGGGLTTRPLGSYQIDDSSLLFDDDDISISNLKDTRFLSVTIEADEWYDEVERVKHILESATTNHSEEDDNYCKVDNFLHSFMSSRRAIQEFQRKSTSLLDTIITRIDRQLQVINCREKFIQSNMKAQLEKFLQIWRQYSSQVNHNKQLTQQVDFRTEKFEIFNNQLKEINSQTGARIRELSDGNKLKELEMLTTRLNEESSEFDLKIGLLLIVYSKIQTKVVSESS